MTQVSLYDNATGTWVVAGGGTDNSYQFGTPFASTDGGYVVGLSWRRVAGASKPAQLALWDTATGEVRALLTSASIFDNGSAGWQVTPLDGPVALVTGREYRVAVQWAIGGIITFIADTDSGSAPSPLLLGDHDYYYNTSAGAMPTTLGTSAIRLGVDVVWNDTGTLLSGATGGTAGGAGGGATTGDLADWLDSVIGTQLHSAPLQTLAGLTDLIAFEKGTGSYSASGVLPTLQQLIIAASAAVSLVTGLQQLLRPGGVGPSSAVVDDTGRTVLSAVNDLFTPINTIARAVQGTSGLTVFPASPWNKVDEVDFDWQKAWDVPADLYTLNVVAIPPHIGAESVDGAIWRPRLGWWAVRNGDLFADRRFINWETSILEDAGRHMPGVVVRTQFGCTCHLEAWSLD